LAQHSSIKLKALGSIPSISKTKQNKKLSETSNKQISEVRKSIQDLDKKVSIMKEKFSKEMEIMKNNQVEMLEMKTSLGASGSHL
jgi:hypothetical protein